jgi:hypothetical protein
MLVYVTHLHTTFVSTIHPHVLVYMTHLHTMFVSISGILAYLMYISYFMCVRVCVCVCVCVYLCVCVCVCVYIYIYIYIQT